MDNGVFFILEGLDVTSNKTLKSVSPLGSRNQKKLDELLKLTRENNVLLKKISDKMFYVPPKKIMGAVLTTPMDCYEYPEMTIKLSPKNWGRVLKGESFTIRGDGYRLDCGNFVSFQWDYWVFEGGINGHLAVEMRTPFVKETSHDHAYNGSMKEVDVLEYEVGGG